ncbi:MAG TPA: crosslink repair DNA glycosylase YcaQ family protein [Thermoanaerobaculia bacterium]|nr:crosslink repair DNA glycosylase YcaQ family protein [Thermoanaerobaculia bacterium]
MPRRRTQLSLAEARRLVLAAQGFDRPRPGSVDVRHLRRVMDRLGLIQIDFVNVLAPAHYVIPYSRLGPYERHRFDDLAYRRREWTEHWAHEASFVPMEHRRLLAHRRDDHRPRPRTFAEHLETNPRYAERVLEEIAERGALAASELPPPEAGPHHLKHSWYSTVARATLEWHFGTGRLAVAARRPDYARLYDLAERIVPEEHRGHGLARDEQHRRLLLAAARAQAVGTAADLADHFRMPVTAARPRLAELVEAGELDEVAVEGWRQTAYLDPAARLPRRVDAAALVSPFDPLVWCRPRTKRLFGFDYKIEIYVPAAERRWGYYVLPFLLGDRLVARIDLKADRKAGVLRVPSAWIEAPAAEHPGPAAVAAALAKELATLAGWLGLGRVAAGRRGDFAPALAGAL